MRDGTLRFCGIDVIDDVTFHAVPYVSDDERRRMLRRVSATLEGLGPAITRSAS